MCCKGLNNLWLYIVVTAVYLGAAVRRENSRYFPILYRHRTLAKLISESKIRCGNGMSEKYVLFWRIGQKRWERNSICVR